MTCSFGLDCIQESLPSGLKGQRIGLLVHAASIDSRFRHAIDIFSEHPEVNLTAILGPQHGLFGQTQDNMVEWESTTHPRLGIPLFSLYGRTRTPSADMLSHIDALVVDLQDVGARPYTYVWTIKNCCAACEKAGIPVWILDRPNPIGALDFDGPLLEEEYFSFVGGAPIPLCHRMTLGEMGLLLKQLYFPKLSLNVVWMKNWWRNSLWSETGLPWVLPSPNMPTLDTAIVYPGMVLLEATNLSEGRGTTRPFELFGAPYLHLKSFLETVTSFNTPGCLFREHGFLPTFQKWQGAFCSGLQLHVTDARAFKPVLTTAAILQAARNASEGAFAFKDPPYEYEAEKMPIDILVGTSALREAVLNGALDTGIQDRWKAGYGPFLQMFSQVSHYAEESR